MEEERGNGEMNKTKKVRVKVAILKKEKCSRNCLLEDTQIDEVQAGQRKRLKLVKEEKRHGDKLIGRSLKISAALKTTGPKIIRFEKGKRRISADGRRHG
jgi:hypothetical protein